MSFFLQWIFCLNTIRHYQRMTNNEYKILLYQFLITQTNSEGIQKLTLNNDMLVNTSDALMTFHQRK